jgi:phthiodiolone/phenolphthiodiolone dimycocerosates ketoreductase
MFLAAGAPRTLSLVGKFGDGWLPIAYTPELYEYHAKIIRDAAKEAERDPDELELGLDIDVYFTEDVEESWARLKNPLKVSLYKPEVLKVHNINVQAEFDFRKYFTEYSMSNPDLIKKMREEAQRIPDEVARSALALGRPDDIIPVFERFIKAGVKHFVIRFWGEGYYKNIEHFGRKVLPYFKDHKH